MTALIIAIAAISLIDIPYMLKKQRKKELAVFIVFAAISFGLGLLLVFNTGMRGAADVILSLLVGIMEGGKE